MSLATSRCYTEFPVFGARCKNNFVKVNNYKKKILKIVLLQNPSIVPHLLFQERTSNRNRLREQENAHSLKQIKRFGCHGYRDHSFEFIQESAALEEMILVCLCCPQRFGSL